MNVGRGPNKVQGCYDVFMNSSEVPAAVGGRRAIIIIIIVSASTMPQSLAVDPAGESVL